MKKQIVQITKLIPSEGMVLTNGDTYRVDYVCLGRNDSPENWHEITMEEYNAIMEKQEKTE